MKHSRRDFLKFSGATISTLALPSSLFAQEPSFSDYKALVVLFNAGGNDSLNMFIPSGDDEQTGYPSYARARENIKIAKNALTLPITNNALDLSAGNPYAVGNDLSSGYTKGFYTHSGMNLATNPLMPELAHLVDQNKVAIIANCGNLIEPATKTEFAAKTKVLPPFLYAHNHQTKLAMNGKAAVLNTSGWAGRLFDNWININGGDIYGMNISVGRAGHLFYGDKTTPLSISRSGPSSYKRLNRTMVDDLLATEDNNKFKKLYTKLQQHSLSMQDTIVSDWNNNGPSYSSVNAYGNALFSMPSNGELNQSASLSVDKAILEQFEAVAKLAYIGKNRGLKRQIFFVYDGGYDTHTNQSGQHAKKLRGLSLALGDFQKALKDMGMENEVTTFNISDFARTTGDNGSGTDHAWGGSYFAMGGAVNGGLYGTLPDLTLESNDDISKKGRLIPTTSMSQYYGTIVKWFGADEAILAKIVPELDNFTLKDIGFMK